MKIDGTVIKVLPVITGNSNSGKSWAKQEFILETDGQYKNKIHMSLWGEDKINKYDLQFGLKITAHIELESKEHNNRWYTEVRAWKIEWGTDQRRWH